MTFTIAFSGAHSTGKTTTLNAIKASGWPDIYVDDYRASRAAQAQMNMELADIVKSKKHYHQLQDLILGHKLSHEEGLRGQGYRYILVDRSPADIYAYTHLWHKADPTVNADDEAWFLRYQDSLERMMAKYDKIINFPIVPEVPFIPEPGRATEDNREAHSRLVNGYLALNARNKTHHLRAVSLGERINEILDVVEALHG